MGVHYTPITPREEVHEYWIQETTGFPKKHPCPSCKKDGYGEHSHAEDGHYL